MENQSIYNFNLPKTEILLIRLAIVRQRYTPFGGAERFIEEALKILAQSQGLALSIYARKWSGQPPNCTAIQCNPFYVGSLWRDFSFIKSVEKHLKTDAPDLIQSHERIAFCDIFRAGDGVHRKWLQLRLKNANLLQKLSIFLNPTQHFRLYAEKKMFESTRLKAVICISEMVKNDILEFFPNAKEKLHVIYNAVDCQGFSPALKNHRQNVLNQRNIPQNARVFLFVGSGFWRKGLKTAILALPENAHLIVVGKDKKMDFYQRLAQGKNVHFLGAQNDPRPFYGAADVFVLPTLYDPLSNAVLEALAAGLPILTTHQCGAGEIVEKFSAGKRFEAEDVGALQNLMQQMTTQNLSELAANARNAALSLSPDKMQGDLLALYQNLLNNENPAH